ncbi:MAG: HD domain-containing protein [Bacteroidaceae bacterium]|nr:HD domain-containing protein [Bacteroidaceae bacterium]
MAGLQLTSAGLEFVFEPSKDYRALTVEALTKTRRKGIKNLIAFMDEVGFFRAPCSGGNHLCQEGGLAEHSWNVYETALKLNKALGAGFSKDTIAICALLHDLGKVGDHNKQMYIENVLKSGKVSASKPYKRNPGLSAVPHAVRSIKLAQRYIELSEGEEWAILCHDGLYDFMKHEMLGKETPLFMVLHWADMWSSRVVERGSDKEEAEE